MKIAIASDLHLEFGDIDLKNTENVDMLIIAGDLLITQYLHDYPEVLPIPPEKEWGFKQGTAIIFREFLKRINDEFPKTIIIAGNHEFYHGKWNQTLCTLKQEYIKYPNIKFLEDDHIILDDIVFVGGTLWTDMNKEDPRTRMDIKYRMNDFEIIRNEDSGYRKLTPDDTIIRHKKTLNYFSKIVYENKDKKIVIVGHHSPSKLSTHYKYAGEFEMNGGYSSDLSEFIIDNPNITLWIHGHTHYGFDYILGETRIICNPRGYAEREVCARNFKLKCMEI